MKLVAWGDQRAGGYIAGFVAKHSGRAPAERCCASAAAGRAWIEWEAAAVGAEIEWAHAAPQGSAKTP